MANPSSKAFASNLFSTLFHDKNLFLRWNAAILTDFFPSVKSKGANSAGNFSFPPPDRWFYAAVETACANGALSGAGHAFRPTDNITREEMAAMLGRGLGYT